jgi:four helix bundle protein
MLKDMNSYRELEIYKLAFKLAVRVHHASLKLPKFELYEQGSQIRRSTKSVKDQIVEGYGRRRYKAEYIKFLTYSQSSCDEALSQVEMLIELYPEFPDFTGLATEYDILGKKINRYIDYVENNWRV